MAAHAPHYAPVLFDRESAAAYLSLSPRTLNEIQSRGDLIPKQFGSKRLFLREDLENYAKRLPDWKPSP